MAYGEFAYWYDRLMDEVPYDEWLRFAEAYWNGEGGGGGRPRTVVDLGCGTGSLAIPLAQRGYRVIGIDLSEHMLAVARDKSERRSVQESVAAAGGSVAWLQQDMREWELAEPADAVVCFCDCLNYLLEEEDVRLAFRRTHAALRSGGTFLFDVHTPQHLRSYVHNQPFTLDEDDIAYIWTCELEEARCEIEHRLSIFVREREDRPDRYRKFQETHVQRAYPLPWLQTELAQAGFAASACYADFTFRPPSGATERAFFVAVKK